MFLPLLCIALLEDTPAKELTLADVACRVYYDNGSSRTLATGGVIKYDPEKRESTVLTCWHLQRHHRGRLMVHFYELGKAFPAEVITWNQTADCMTVRVPNCPPVFACAMAKEVPKPGDPVWSVGCDRGWTPVVLSERVVSVDKYIGFNSIVTSVVRHQGSSGGLLYNAAGEVCGVQSGSSHSIGGSLKAGLRDLLQLLTPMFRW